jgi:muramidase (phage lysozyme)
MTIAITPNQAAFLSMIRTSEGTAKYPNPWAVTFGGKYTITDFSDHPAITGEWLGDRWAGGWSTAAGAYQIIKGTWLSLAGRLHLMDFSAPSQNEAAIELIREKGVLDLIDQGSVERAITACSSVWASLPGSTSGQPQNEMAAVVGAYMAAGGSYA